jgi:lipid II:glycine glycyltransferase (peptidoglycan interpeptide bridge formation enzyme)
LRQPESTLWENVHPKHRNVIRNAEKKGVEVNTTQDLGLVHRLITGTLQRSGLKFIALRDLETLVEALADNIRILVAHHQGRPQGCAVLPFSRYGAYYLYGGSIERPLTGAMNFLQWEAIKRFQACQVERYDFVGARINPDKGSKQEGLALFKERFGGAFHSGFLWKYPLNRAKYSVYCAAVRLLRGGDIVDEELKRLKRPSGESAAS